MKKIQTGEELLHKLYKELYLEYKKEHNLQHTEKIAKVLKKLEDVSKKAIEHGKCDLLKQMYYEKYIIKKLPESYYQLQYKIAIERGYGQIDFIKEFYGETFFATVVSEQKKSLDRWIDYLSNSDAMYPLWAKYWAFQGMLKIGVFDKKNEKFTKRTKNTTNPFIELNKEALSLSISSMKKYIENNALSNDENLNKLLTSSKFYKIYEYYFTKIITDNLRFKTPQTQGIWVKYNQNSDYMILVNSLNGKGTGWCTAGEETAKEHLETGDFYVFYTIDENKEYKVPRIAIRMMEDYIEEVRGINEGQKIEEELHSILIEKINTLPNASYYLKKESDLKYIDSIYNKYQNSESLTIEDLIFIYEIKSEIVRTSCKEDFRLVEIKNSRNYNEDIAIIYGCDITQVSNNLNDILVKENIKFFKGNINTKNYRNKTYYIPEIVYGSVIYNELNSQNIQLPQLVSEIIIFENLTSLNCLQIPDDFYCETIEYKDRYYNSEEFIKLVNSENHLVEKQFRFN